MDEKKTKDLAPKKEKFTPGPWVGDMNGVVTTSLETGALETVCNTPVAFVRNKISGGPAGMTSGTQYDLSRWAARAVCNTALIAAAPDMFTALVVLAEHAREMYPHFESERGQRDIAAAMAALSKARGE